MFTKDGFEFVYLPLLDGGIARRRVDRLSDSEKQFVEQSKDLDPRVPEQRAAYRKLVDRLLTK